jgi:hemoglobin-like flavoprotein
VVVVSTGFRHVTHFPCEMGCTHSNITAEGGADFDALQARQKVFEKKMTVPLALQIAHFTPASFPLVPVINRQVNKLCTASWNTLVEQEFEGEGGTMISGITIFYNEFYKRLAIFDSKGMFEAVLSRHSGSANKVAVKGSILVRIIKYVLAIFEDSEETQLALYVLGKSHQQKQIRPWQYSVFIETLLNTLANQLGVCATADVMYAWVNLFAYVLQSMLPPAIEGLTLSNELNVNTSTIFDSVEADSNAMANSADLNGVSRPEGASGGKMSAHVSGFDRNLLSVGKSLNSAKNISTLRV